jgi:hypothetical protein
LFFSKYRNLAIEPEQINKDISDRIIYIFLNGGWGGTHVGLTPFLLKILGFGLSDG